MYCEGGWRCMRAADLRNREEIREDTGRRQHTAQSSVLCSRINMKLIGQGIPEGKRSARVRGCSLVAPRIHAVGPHLPTGRARSFHVSCRHIAATTAPSIGSDTNTSRPR